MTRLKILILKFHVLPLLFLGLLSPTFLSQESTSLKIIENQGQWDDHILYKLPMNGGDIYFEGATTTYCLYDKSLYGKAKHGEYSDSVIPGHTYRTKLIGANPNFQNIQLNPHSFYYNFFIGNDQSKWKSKVKAYSKIRYNNIYEGIDQVFYESYGKTKYDFVVTPYGNPGEIMIQYEGATNIKIEKGHLVIYTSVGKVIEQSPYAYQFVDGEEKKVECKYAFSNNLLTFVFPDGYDRSLDLIIDPVLTFGTYTGSSADNFGCTAANDLAGNMYVGGTVFGSGYPSTTGPFQIGFGGGNIDMGISKFSANGSNLIYSSYIGGSANEIPHSLIVNNLDQLVILGTSNSVNYPVSTGCYQNVMQGGTATTFGGYGFNFTTGCDMVITKLTAAGTALVGSTFLGGSGNDGLNAGSLLHYNYGDAFRGEVINGPSNEVIISSTTSSFNFPTSAGAIQTALSGPSDAVLVKLSADLSTLLYATYIGGSSFDSGYSVQLNSSGEMYMCGGTISTDFPGTSNGLNPTYLGGTSDGFLARFSASGASLLNATYIGTSDYDQNFFVQTDSDDDVYTIGQTAGTYPIFNVAFSNANSGQYIQKLTPDLSTSIWSTTIGRSTGEVDIAVNAFLVSDCDFIYLSGWGGPLNGNTSLGGHATSSSTLNLPITADAFQTSTNGSDFYLAVLGPDASSLLYATYFGGSISAEHADGGTSRFDKSGTVYQAVCAGCGGNSDFPTTSGAWSNFNNANNCNLGAFKFDLGSITPAISIPQPYVCIPSSYQFSNNSSGGNQYLWYFGDGDSSYLEEPSHDYLDTGHYEVLLIVSDSLGCLETDTASLFLDVFALNNASVDFVDTICKGDSALLNAYGGATYQWFPTAFLSNPQGQSTYAFPPTTTTYTVYVHDSCGTDTAQITVPVYNDNYFTMNDTLICAGFPVTLVAYGGISYSWLADPSFQNPTSQTPTANPPTSTMYYVEITMSSGCVYLDSVFVETVNSLPIPSLNNDTVLCIGNQLNLTATGGDTYVWFPLASLVNVNGNTATTNITANETVYVEISNACGVTTDSVFIEVIDVYPQIVADTTICPGDTALLWASGGASYSWSPSTNLSAPNSDTTFAMPEAPTTYTVAVTNPQGCSKTLSTFVNLYPKPIAKINSASYITYGTTLELNGITNAASYYWESTDSVYCITCLETFSKPEQSATYILFVEDTNGCRNSDTLEVFLDGSLYVPNTFTPNGDGVNDLFAIKGIDIKTFQLYIFNRWGQLLYETTDMNDYWDATYKGTAVQIDSYVWKIEYEDYQQTFKKLIGHVNVLR